MTIDEINALRNAIMNCKHISEKELFDFAYKANEEGKCFKLAIKIKDEYYKKWYDNVISENPSVYQEDLSDETLYITTTDNKAFKSGMCGYSIFGESIASKIRSARGVGNISLDRIERAPIEFAAILGEC